MTLEVLLRPFGVCGAQRRKIVDKDCEVLGHLVAGAIPCGIELEGCDIPVSPKHGVIAVCGAVYAYQHLKRSDRDVWGVVGAHRIANRQVFLEREGELIDDAHVAELWIFTAGQKKRIPSDRITVTVSAEWLASSTEITRQHSAGEADYAVGWLAHVDSSSAFSARKPP